ncbi:beta-1,4-galactosyltransferase galt-1-like isoform X1 [Oryzias melastigma]|uniref:beta-1,4-galactosyltransferase galt-1-like isoform X1 n=2 Tax=Oryzias melastigma TaxID=30732 RepID=UPI000CF7F63D|nr:beta-1,4-galactosyltransferase galt-1-like isoform X1 [Oryzias melastigma]
MLEIVMIFKTGNTTCLWKRDFVLLIFTVVMVILLYSMVTEETTTARSPVPKLQEKTDIYPVTISEESITPIKNTKHLLVSAFIDRRVNGFDIRIIGIFKRDSIQPLHCSFYCGGVFNQTTPAQILPHSDNFGYPYTATDVLCPLPKNCDASHVTLLTKPSENMSEHTFIPVRNKNEKTRFNFTVCVSNLFGDYNNVLQFAQTLEMYKLLGVDRVVIYNTSCGPDLERLLQRYSQEGFVEMVPWPIDKFLKLTRGWRFTVNGGDLQYYGQLVTLNECMYRSMERSRYVLLNDIDEIIMPYKHDDLVSLMNTLEPQHPNVGEFLIENHIFPYKHFEPSGRFHLPQWEKVPGINILEHIYREDPDRSVYHPHKMIVRPKLIEQTSVHEVLRKFGERYKVPLDVCRIIHVRVALRGHLKLEELNEDKRLWDFQEKLIPNVDKALKRAELIPEQNKL